MKNTNGIFPKINIGRFFYFVKLKLINLKSETATGGDVTVSGPARPVGGSQHLVRQTHTTTQQYKTRDYASRFP